MENIEQQQTGDLFVLTRSAYLNDLVNKAKELYDDDFDPDFYIDDYRANLERYKGLMGQLKEFYGNLKQIQEDTPVIMEQNAVIEQSLELLFQGIRTMEDYFEYNEKEKIIEGLAVVKENNEAILKAIDTIRAEEERLPRHSPSPFIHEIIRVAQGVLHKGFPREALKEKLDGMSVQCDAFFRDFQIYKLARFETSAIADRVPEAEAALGRLREGLRIMAQFLEDDAEEHIAEGTALLAESSKALMEFSRFAERELQGPSTKLCVKCGIENDRAQKYCTECSAVLPESKGAQEGTMLPSAFDELMIAGDERTYTSNMMMLASAIQEHRAGRTSKEALQKIIEWMEEKITHNSAALEAMEMPDLSDSPEEQEALAATRELLEQGARELEDALAGMKTYFDDGDMAHLTAGLQRALDASDKLVQVQDRSSAALSAS